MSAEPVRLNDQVYSVVIADDDASIRSFLATLIEEDPALELMGEAADAEQAIRLTVKGQADAVVLDWWMPEGGGPRAAREITERSPTTGIVAFTAFNGAAPSGEMLAAGAKIYLVKSERSNDEIIAAIKRAARA